jgi:hypothetical protein
MLALLGFSIANGRWIAVALFGLLLVAPPAAALWYRRKQESA